MAHWTKPNHNMVAEYQASSMPFVTSSQTSEVDSSTPTSIHFPGVTRWMQITNTGDADLRIGFTSNGVQSKGATTGSNAVDGVDLSDNLGYAKGAGKADHANYYLLKAPSTSTHESTVRWEIKCNKVFFLADSGDTDFTMIAGITNIPNDGFVHLSGSNGYRGVG